MADAPAQFTDLVSGDLASRLKQLLLFSRHRVEGRYLGENRSVRKGFSTDFMQHRQYFPGDNIKYLDWRIYGRTDRYFVREYEQPTNLDLYLVVDCSASMSFAGDGQSKHDFAVRVAAIFIYLMMLQQDHYGLSLVGATLRAHADPAAGRRHLQRLYEMLLSSPPAGVCDWEGAMRQTQARVTRRGLVLVLSDFLGDPEAIGRGLAGFRSRRCDAIAFHLIHPEEADLSRDTMTRYVDLEDGSSETVDPLLIREAYQEQFRRHGVALRQECSRRGIEYCPLTVGPDYETAIGDYLRHRLARLR